VDSHRRVRQWRVRRIRLSNSWHIYVYALPDAAPKSYMLGASFLYPPSPVTVQPIDEISGKPAGGSAGSVNFGSFLEVERAGGRICDVERRVERMESAVGEIATLSKRRHRGLHIAREAPGIFPMHRVPVPFVREQPGAGKRREERVLIRLVA
jgi:hypothetical protein